jgi:hypothetical protein
MKNSMPLMLLAIVIEDSSFTVVHRGIARDKMAFGSIAIEMAGEAVFDSMRRCRGIIWTGIQGRRNVPTLPDGSYFNDEDDGDVENDFEIQCMPITQPFSIVRSPTVGYSFGLCRANEVSEILAQVALVSFTELSI